MLSNAYFLAKFRFDTAENEPAKNLQNLLIFPIGRGEASAATEATAPLESTSRREIALFSQDYQVCSIRDNQKTLHAIRVAVSLRARTASE